MATIHVTKVAMPGFTPPQFLRVRPGIMRGGRGGGVLPEASVTADPGEEALDHPSARMDRKADLVGRLPDDLDGNAGGARGPLSGIARIREGFGDERERASRQPQDPRRAIPVLDVGWLGLQDEATPGGVDHDLPLAPLHLLAGVVASRAAALGGLDALAVEHRGRGRRLAADPLAISHDEQVVDRLEQALVTPSAEPAEDRAPRRQVARQKPPRDAAAQEIKDRIKDLPQRPFPRPPSGTRLWHQGLDQSPLGVGQISFVTQPFAAMLPPSGRGPHRGSREGFDNPSESLPPRPLNPFPDGLSVRAAHAGI